MSNFLSRASSTPIRSAFTKQEIETDIAQLNSESRGPIEFQARIYNGTAFFEWDITFRRSTRLGAFRANRQSVDRANRLLQDLATKYGVTYSPYTEQRAKASDQDAEDDGESAYSEYEQSIGGGFKFKI